MKLTNSKAKSKPFWELNLNSHTMMVKPEVVGDERLGAEPIKYYKG